jgi:hypothetical protein
MTFFSKLLLSENVRFIEDKLQKITIWTSGRNESASNSTSHNSIILERSLFLNEFRTKRAIENATNIFPELLKLGEKTNLSQAQKKFLIGYRLAQVQAPDYISFGANLIYESYEENKAEVDSICKSLSNESFSGFCYNFGSLLDSRPNENSIRRILARVWPIRMTYRIAKKTFRWLTTL